MSEKDKAAINKAVVNLVGIDDYKKYFPDLYERMEHASSFDEIYSAIHEGEKRAVSTRISNRPECAVVPEPIGGLMKSDYPSGHFVVSGFAAIRFIVASGYVIFGFQDSDDPEIFSHGGYRYLFEDGTQSDEMQCTYQKIGAYCADKTSDIGARLVYEELQKKTISAIKTATKKYDISKSTADKVRTMFSCISP
jgi:hypothetical protein